MICQELNNNTKAVKITRFQFQRKQIKDDVNYLKENLYMVNNFNYIYIYIYKLSQPTVGVPAGLKVMSAIYSTHNRCSF